MTAEALNRKSIDEAFVSARTLQAAGDLAAAKQAYEKLLRQVPVHAEAMTMLASICYQQGEDIQADAYLDRAIEIYQAVLQHQPDSMAAKAAVANVLLARRRAREAEAHLGELVLQLNPIRATPEEFVRRRRSAIDRGLGSILINTVPKSASESIWNRLAAGLGMAQCHFSLGLYPECRLIPSRLAAAAEGGLVAKEHLPAVPYNLELLRRFGIERIIFHVRDPRQATLSWAHFVNDDVAMRLLAPIWRQVVPPAGVLGAGFEAVLDWCVEHYLPQLIEFMRAWERVHIDGSTGIQVAFFSFERFLETPESYMEEMLEFLVIDPSWFDSRAEAETVHLRKGQTEEWREAMTGDQRNRAWQALPRDMCERFRWSR